MPMFTEDERRMLADFIAKKLGVEQGRVVCREGKSANLEISFVPPLVKGEKAGMFDRLAHIVEAMMGATPEMGSQKILELLDRWKAEPALGDETALVRELDQRMKAPKS